MNYTDWLPYLIITALAVVFLYQLSKTKTLTIADIKTAVEKVTPLAAQIEPAARMAVLAAEEYGRTGRLITSEEKLRYAIKVFRDLVPASTGISEETMLDAIHSFIPLANSLGVKVEIKEIEQTIVSPMQSAGPV